MTFLKILGCGHSFLVWRPTAFTLVIIILLCVLESDEKASESEGKLESKSESKSGESGKSAKKSEKEIGQQNESGGKQFS